jgi:hypothetical protein
MPRITIDVRGSRPLLDLVSFGRKGPGRRDRLSSVDIEHIRRTIDRTPEVMVKVLSKGGQDPKAVSRHLDYLSRRGDLELETDDGERIAGKDAQKSLLEDWGLDLDDSRRRTGLLPRQDSRPPKLVHKVMFSMPAGTPGGKVLQAVRKFAIEEFALQHRFALVLHTDEPHPHVHMVVKAISEQGERLNIRKDTLRRWRAEFARHLRALGLPANATERAVRGQSHGTKPDGIYRALRRGESSHMATRIIEVSDAVAQGRIQRELGKATMTETRSAVTRGWLRVSELLNDQGESELAARVRGFVDAFQPPLTEREFIAEQLRYQVAQQRTGSIDGCARPR